MRGIRDWGLGISGGEKGDSPHLCTAPFGPFRQMGTVPFFPSGQWEVGNREILIPNPQSLIPSSRRRALTLIEVIVSLGVLTVGLLSIAALIPMGRIALRETNKSDRTGACGRASIQDIKIQRMLDYNSWRFDGTQPTWWVCVTQPDNVPLPQQRIQPFAIDPLGVASRLTGNLGGTPSPLARLSFTGWTQAMADAAFRWNDELGFDIPEGSSKRPRQLVRDSTVPNSRVGPYPQLPGEPPLVGALTPQNEGNFSWFVTVSPAASEAGLPMTQKRLFDVSVVVCNQRVLSTTSEYAATANFPGGAMPMMPGGGTIQLTNVQPAANPPLQVKYNQWVALVGRNPPFGPAQICQWYRVVGVNNDNPAQPMLTLDGPDWPAQTYQNPTVIIIDGVTGVYTTTLRLE
jgi:hypothetical protein